MSVRYLIYIIPFIFIVSLLFKINTVGDKKLSIGRLIVNIILAIGSIALAISFIIDLHLFPS